MERELDKHSKYSIWTISVFGLYWCSKSVDVFQYKTEFREMNTQVPVYGEYIKLEYIRFEKGLIRIWLSIE